MDDEVLRATDDVDCYDVPCPVCGAKRWVSCNNDPADEGHKRRWAMAGAVALRDLRG